MYGSYLYFTASCTHTRTHLIASRAPPPPPPGAQTETGVGRTEPPGMTPGPPAKRAKGKEKGVTTLLLATY